MQQFTQHSEDKMFLTEEEFYDYIRENSNGDVYQMFKTLHDDGDMVWDPQIKTDLEAKAATGKAQALVDAKALVAELEK